MVGLLNQNKLVNLWQQSLDEFGDSYLALLNLW